LVQNLSRGTFDLFVLKRNKRIFSLTVPSYRNYVKPSEFSEKDRVIVLGSEDGIIRVCDVQTGGLLQELVHGGGRTLIKSTFIAKDYIEDTPVQALAVGQSSDQFLIVAGSSSSRTVSVWAKKVRY
jgi:WD40 repeat protein